MGLQELSEWSRGQRLWRQQGLRRLVIVGAIVYIEEYSSRVE